jgi:hypothetical protein
LNDPSPDKRQQLIERLLNSPAHATHLAVTWRKIMLPGEIDPQQAGNAAGLENWLRRQFAANLRYDRVVAEFLVASGSGEEGPVLFYTSQELKPEKLASSTARIFLGLQIGCAECHDHPFDHWRREDFWNYAAFFARLQQPSTDLPQPGATSLVELTQGELPLPESDQMAKPRFPGGDFATEQLGTRRQLLAVWMTSRENPFLARAAVNWAWSHMFGRGLVEPVDDLGPRNPPSHPQLLDELTSYFANTGFDLQNLFRTLANTQAYQLSSQMTESVTPPELFARMGVKSLTPEQLYDSVQRVIARRSQSNSAMDANRFLDPRRQMFISKIHTQSREPLSFQAGMPQALLLMNGGDVAEAVDVQRSGLLNALRAPFLDDAQRLEILYLAALSRRPSEDEAGDYLAFVAEGTDADDRFTRLGDVLWALLNTSEFALNH